MGNYELWLFWASERWFVVFATSFMCRLLSLSVCSRCLHPRCAPASEDPACESIDTNVTCWGDGELLSTHVQEAGFYQMYTHAKVEEGITVIGSNCFFRCTCLYSIDLPSSVVEYKGAAFSGTAITTFLVGKSVTRIAGAGVWNGCDNLTHFYVESGNTIVTASNGFLFKNGDLYAVGGGRDRDMKLTLPDCTTILTSAMRWNGCSELVISDTTTTIQSDAFYGGAFTKVTLGKKVASIDSKAFSMCNNLQTIDLNGNNNFYMSSGQFGAKNTAGNPTSILWVSSDITSMTIAKTVTSIGVPLIQRCANLSSISVASGNTNFGVACSNQLVVDTKSNNKWTRTCHCVGGATSIEVPSNIVTIGNGCFWKCNLLTELIFHSGVNCFDHGVFRECANLVSVDFRGCTMKCNGKAITTSHMAAISRKLKTIVSWPSNNFATDDSSFRSCGFTFLQLPDQCISIGMRCFESCSQLETVIIPKTTTSIGMQAFYNCQLLRNVTFAAGSTLTQLSGLSFSQCTNMRTITLPSMITDMTANCFGYDSNLTEIKFTSDTTTFAAYDGAVYKKSGSNKYYTFYICPPGVSTIILNDDTVEIGANSFYGCTKLRDVIMNNKLTKLSTSAFTQCDVIEFIRIPGTVTSIGKRAVVLCPNLKRVLYCSDNDSIEYEGDPFPSNPAIYLLYGSESTCNFAGHECERILDSECNIPTNSFTRASVTTLFSRRMRIYSYMCWYVTNEAQFVHIVNF